MGEITIRQPQVPSAKKDGRKSNKRGVQAYNPMAEDPKMEILDNIPPLSQSWHELRVNRDGLKSAHNMERNTNV